MPGDFHLERMIKRVKGGCLGLLRSRSIAARLAQLILKSTGERKRSAYRWLSCSRACRTMNHRVDTDPSDPPGCRNRLLVMLTTLLARLLP